MSLRRRVAAVGFVAALAISAGTLVSAPAIAEEEGGDRSSKGLAELGVSPEKTVATFAELDFEHPVSLESASTVVSAVGLEVQGYHFVSDSIIGDYWPDAGLSVDEFLQNIKNATGTAPEIVSAYVLADELENRSVMRGAPAPLGSELPAFDAPDADVSLAVPPATMNEDGTSGDALRAAGDTWQPNDVEVMVGSMADNLSISAKYAWWGLSPFASPQVMANHWGMEFQFDFYTRVRQSSQLPGIGYGARPNCGATTLLYKDWAAASTRPYS